MKNDKVISEIKGMVVEVSQEYFKAELGKCKEVFTFTKQVFNPDSLHVGLSITYQIRENKNKQVYQYIIPQFN